MISDCILTNAKAYFNNEIVECSLAIDEGKIQRISKETHMPKADIKIDLQNKLVLPGVIDSHVHLRDQDKAYKETFLTGTAAAAAGGVTTVLDMPNNSPVTMSADTLRNRMQIARHRIFVNVGFYSEYPAKTEEIKAIVKEGAVGFKLFMAEQVGGLNIDDDQALEAAFNETSEVNIPVAVHAEDHDLLKKSVDHLKQSNHHDIIDFLKAHDEMVEYKAVEHLLALSNGIQKLRLHFCHISTSKAIDAISKAKKAKEFLTCEATPHHLLCTKNTYNLLGTSVLTMPPFRTQENIDALWRGITEKLIDTIGSDHAPHTLTEKEAGSVWDIKLGIPGLETILPLMLNMVHKNKITLERATELLSKTPADIFRLTDRGRLEEGKNADLVVVDFNEPFKIDTSKFKSKAKFSPFDKWDVQGKPLKTFVNGTLVMDEGEIVAKPGVGDFVRRQYP